MVALLSWTVAAFAFCWIIADSKISLGVRTWLADRRSRPIAVLLMLLECVSCTGFHVGWIAQLAGLTPFGSWWLAAFYTCGANLLLAKYVGMLDPE